MKELYQIASEGDDHWWKDSTQSQRRDGSSEYVALQAVGNDKIRVWNKTAICQHLIIKWQVQAVLKNLNV
jgi:hypothetical protein